MRLGRRGVTMHVAVRDEMAADPANSDADKSVPDESRITADGDSGQVMPQSATSKPSASRSASDISYGLSRNSSTVAINPLSWPSLSGDSNSASDCERAD